jgi:hypothetical protein
MRTLINFPAPYFRRLVARLLVAPHTPLLCPVGSSRLNDEAQYLARSVTEGFNRSAGEQWMVVSTTERIPDETTLTAPLRTAGATAHLVLGCAALEGRVWGVAKAPASGAHNKSFVAVDGLLLPGAGMPELSISLPGQLDAGRSLPEPPAPSSLARWSRTIGALGLREWRRLTSLHIAIIGCGRTGSLIATTLARLGIRRLTLLDPDRIEEHNLGEMDGVTEADIGQSKAIALARFLREHCASSQVGLSLNAVAEPIVAAYQAALAADTLFCCVDNDAARLACGIIATLFHKVLVDVGTGIHSPLSQPEIRNRIMGADIRLLLPADGCLVCFGKLANYEAALAALAQGRRAASRQWWEQRNGSLRTLNMLAASVAVQMLCDLIAGRVQASVWTQMQYEQSGALRVEQIVRRAAEDDKYCPLCLRAGLGSDGIFWNSDSSLQPNQLADGKHQ